MALGRRIDKELYEVRDPWTVLCRVSITGWDHVQFALVFTQE